MQFHTPHDILLHYQQKRQQKASSAQSSFLSQDNIFNIPVKRRTGVRFLGDLYHISLSIGWTAFFAAATGAYFFINLLFSLCFFCLPHGVSNVQKNDFWADFFFSVQTLSTVGYGYLYPQGYLANAIASIEVFVGVVFTAIITGLVYARFSRPRAAVLFSRVATLSQRGEHMCLNFRVGNLRRTPLINVELEAIIARTQKDDTGRETLQLDTLPLTHGHIPLLPVSLSFTHTVTEESPIYERDKEALLQQQAVILLTLTATDPVSAQSVFSYRMYKADDLLPKSRFVSLLQPNNDGVLEVDFSLFHSTIPDGTSDTNNAPSPQEPVEAQQHPEDAPTPPSEPQG